MNTLSPTPLTIAQKRTKHKSSINQDINISDEELQEIANYWTVMKDGTTVFAEKLHLPK